jgi:site-specific recombinase XerD
MAVVHEPHFGAARDLFALHCKAKGLSIRTLETYLSSIDELGTFLTQSDCGDSIPLPQDIRAFVASLLDRSLARTTISIRLRSVRCFFNFLAREEIIATSPMASVEIPRLPARYPEVLTEAEIKAILAAARQRTWTATRNRTMLLMLLDTGVRLGELISLDPRDLDLRAARVRVRNGKGERERYVFVGRTLLRSLRTWLDARGTGQECWPLFMTRGGERLDRRNVQRILERISAKAGL